MNENYQNCSAIILAAGLGTRMKSRRAKVLHPLLGRPLISYAVSLAQTLEAAQSILVVGHQADAVRSALEGVAVDFAMQDEQLGTGHAVQQAMSQLRAEEGPVLILCGDVPLLRPDTLRRLLAHHRESSAALTVLTTQLAFPEGYGRIVRSPSGNILKIVEEKDASDEEREIGEVNTGIYCAEASYLRESIHSLSSRNAQQEYYLTDLVEMAHAEQKRVSGMVCLNASEVMGINARDQLAQAEAILREQVNHRHMQAGVTLIDPDRTYIGMDVDIGADTTVYPDCYLEGITQIGSGCIIGPNTRIVNSEIGNNVEFRGFCMLTEATVEDGAILGPFCHLRPGADIRSNARIGNFVEVKQSLVGAGSKVNHLAYIGDTEMGEGVNIGAGTITCNYDGVRKHKTLIGNRVFVGSDTQFIAPVRIGDRSLIGAGSTITRDVPADSLAVSRAEQKTVEGGAAKLFDRLRREKK